MEELNYIVIEGVIGAGKTSLATMLAKSRNAHIVMEKHEENPFLVDFYRDPKHYAFQTELYFLLSRYRQQTEEFSQVDLFHKLTISDYLFAKNRIFAQNTLDEREYSMFNTVATIIERDIPVPDLVVYLQSTRERLMRNIKKRDRSYERQMSPDYIQSLIESYNRYFFHYDQSPLLIVNSTELDFVEYPDQFKDLMTHILNAPQGTTYYNPGSGGFV